MKAFDSPGKGHGYGYSMANACVHETLLTIDLLAANQTRCCLALPLASASPVQKTLYSTARDAVLPAPCVCLLQGYDVRTHHFACLRDHLSVDSPVTSAVACYRSLSFVGPSSSPSSCLPLSNLHLLTSFCTSSVCVSVIPRSTYPRYMHFVLGSERRCLSLPSPRRSPALVRRVQ